MGRVTWVVLACASFFACKKLDEKKPDVVEQVLPYQGAFVVNEGNYGSANGSLSYINFTTNEISNQVFEAKNGEPVGDIFQSMIIHKEKAFLAVDVSKKVLVIDVESLELLEVVQMSGGPRNMVVDEANNTLWVSQYGGFNVVGLDLNDYHVKHQIDLTNYDIPGVPIPSGSDHMLLTNNELLVTNFRANYLYVVNANNGVVTDSVSVGYDAKYITSGDNQSFWVGTSLDYNHQSKAKLLLFSKENKELIAQLHHADYGFSKLQYVSESNKLYALHNGVKSFWNSGDSILSASVVPAVNGQNFYGMRVQPATENIFITDAIDYVQQGEVLVYNKHGAFLRSYISGYIPNDLVFY